MSLFIVSPLIYGLIITIEYVHIEGPGNLALARNVIFKVLSLKCSKSKKREQMLEYVINLIMHFNNVESLMIGVHIVSTLYTKREI